MNCDRDCTTDRCPFVRDANHPNRYVCLKCDRERNLDKHSGSEFILAALTAAVLAIFLV